ncbi:MAG: AsmA family protein [Nitrospirota bacterium]|nr:AsmA family protein [Nitrospirota bacterium]MDX2420661.1 AsmA family protein [Nitrospirota bacterium]
MRKFMVAVAIVLVLLGAIILMLPFLLDLNRYRDQYLPILEQALHRKVEVEDVRLTLFPTLGVQLRQVVVADDPTLSSKPFLTVPSVQVAVQWKPLLQRRIEVESVLIENPILQVIRSEKGDFNTSTIGKISTSGEISSEKAEPQDSVSPFLGVLAVKRFSMTGGTLQYEDRTHQPLQAYQIEKLVLNTESVAIGETAGVRVHGMLMPYQVPFDVNGRLGPLQANLDIAELDFVGHLGKVVVTAQGKILNGQLTLDVQIPKASTDDVPVELGLIKPIGVTQLQAHLVAPLFLKEPQSPPTEATIDPFRLNLHFGQSLIHVSGKGTPSRVSLVGDSPTLFSQDLPVLLPVQQPFSLEQIQFEVEIQGATLTLQSLKAKVFDGTLLATGTLDRTRPPFTFSTQGTFKEFLVEPLATVIQPSSLSITGIGDVIWKVNGVVTSSKNPTFDGPIHLTLRNGEVIGFDLVKVIEDALQMSGVLGESTGTTSFSLIDAKTELEKGDLAIRELTAYAPNFSLRSAGKLGLDQSVNLKGALGVPPAIADKIIRRFPMAKVVRKKGQLELPFVVGGTVQNPVLRLDTQSLGNQVQKKVEERLKKALQGDDRELQKLLDEGKDLLKQLFRK